MAIPATDPEARFTPVIDVHAQVLFGETVLLDVNSGIYFGLNEVGTRIWELLSHGSALGSVTAAVAQEFDVEQEELARDLAAFVRELESRGLIHREHEGAVSAGAEAVRLSNSHRRHTWP